MQLRRSLFLLPPRLTALRNHFKCEVVHVRRAEGRCGVSKRAPCDGDRAAAFITLLSPPCMHACSTAKRCQVITQIDLSIPPCQCAEAVCCSSASGTVPVDGSASSTDDAPAVSRQDEDPTQRRLRESQRVFERVNHIYNLEVRCLPDKGPCWSLPLHRVLSRWRAKMCPRT